MDQSYNTYSDFESMGFIQSWEEGLERSDFSNPTDLIGGILNLDKIEIPKPLELVELQSDKNNIQTLTTTSSPSPAASSFSAPLLPESNISRKVMIGAGLLLAGGVAWYVIQKNNSAKPKGLSGTTPKKTKKGKSKKSGSKKSSRSKSKQKLVIS